MRRFPSLAAAALALAVSGPALAAGPPDYMAQPFAGRAPPDVPGPKHGRANFALPASALPTVDRHRAGLAPEVVARSPYLQELQRGKVEEPSAVRDLEGKKDAANAKARAWHGRPGPQPGAPPSGSLSPSPAGPVAQGSSWAGVTSTRWTPLDANPTQLPDGGSVEATNDGVAVYDANHALVRTVDPWQWCPGANGKRSYSYDVSAILDRSPDAAHKGHLLLIDGNVNTDNTYDLAFFYTTVAVTAANLTPANGHCIYFEWNGYWPDYPHVALTSNDIYASGNLFGVTPQGSSWAGGYLQGFAKPADPTQGWAVVPDQLWTGLDANGAMPAAMATAAGYDYVVGTPASNTAGPLNQWQVTDGVGNAAPTVGASPVQIAGTGGCQIPADAPQPGTTVLVDAGDCRLNGIPTWAPTPTTNGWPYLDACQVTAGTGGSKANCWQWDPGQARVVKSQTIGSSGYYIADAAVGTDFWNDLQGHTGAGDVMIFSYLITSGQALNVSPTGKVATLQGTAFASAEFAHGTNYVADWGVSGGVDRQGDFTGVAAALRADAAGSGVVCLSQNYGASGSHTWLSRNACYAGR